MIYRALFTSVTRDLILQQARYLAVDQLAPLNAARWLERIYDGVDTLEQWSRRCTLASENRYRQVGRIGIIGVYRDTGTHVTMQVQQTDHG